MPPLSSHFRFATLVMPPLGIASHVDAFLLGTIAPDSFDSENEASFCQYHFKGTDERISLDKFMKETNFTFKTASNSSWAFRCGYYSHLWLDVYYRDNTDHLPFKRPAGKPDTEVRNLVRRETEILNAPFASKLANLFIPQPKDFLSPLGLEFVDVNRCIHLFHDVIRQSQTWSQLVPTFDTIDEAQYTAFFGDVSKIFTNEFQKAA